MRPNSNVEGQLSSKLNGGSGSGRDSGSWLAALSRRCELEVSVLLQRAADDLSF